MDTAAVRAEAIRQHALWSDVLALLDAPPPVEPPVEEPPIVVEPPAPSVLVTFPSAETHAILGPQVKVGVSPWPWFDSNALSRGIVHGNAFPASYEGVSSDIILNEQYYDQGLVQYLNYYRSGDEQYLTLARKVTDVWYDRLQYDVRMGWGTSPRNSSLGGVILRALDGRPELWPFITSWVRGMFQMWTGARIAYPELYFGVRDGGYMLLYAAQLAQVHPEEAVRAEFRQKAIDAATKYYVRLQAPDGGWYWKDDGTATKPGGVWEQPFMVGLLLEALIEVHQMTGDPAIASAITRSVDHLWATRMTTTVPEAAGKSASWRAVPYFVFIDGTTQGETNLAGATATREGWDTNTIREARQRNSLVIHAFGYAYQLTKDAKYRAWGDELFAATYGKGAGPLADPWYGLGDFRAKEWNQAYRSAGRYLGWRAD